MVISIWYGSVTWKIGKTWNMKLIVFYSKVINSLECLGMFFSSEVLIRRLRRYAATVGCIQFHGLSTRQVEQFDSMNCILEKIKYIQHYLVEEWKRETLDLKSFLKFFYSHDASVSICDVVIWPDSTFAFVTYFEKISPYCIKYECTALSNNSHGR